MLDTIFCISEEFQDKLFTLKDRHRVGENIRTDQAQRLSDLKRNCALRRAVEDDIARESDSIGSLVVIHHEDR